MPAVYSEEVEHRFREEVEHGPGGVGSLTGARFAFGRGWGGDAGPEAAESGKRSAGQRIGEVRHVELSSPCSGASGFTYAEATETQRLPAWVAADTRMVEYFGGGGGLLGPDGEFRRDARLSERDRGRMADPKATVEVKTGVAVPAGSAWRCARTPRTPATWSCRPLPTQPSVTPMLEQVAGGVNWASPSVRFK